MGINPNSPEITNNSLNKNLDENGIIQFTTDSGCKYLATIKELENGSGIWSLEFLNFGNPSESEVFKTMRNLTDSCMQYVNRKNITTAILSISDKDQEVLDKKTKIFQRWLSEDWQVELLKEETTILGRKIPITLIDGNILLITKL